MSNKDWEQFGNDILKTVQDAIESCNYDRLNQTVGDAVNQVVDGISKNVKNMANNASQANQRREAQKQYNTPNYQQTKYQKMDQTQIQNFLQRKAATFKKPTKVLGGLLFGFGFAISAILVILSILFVFVSIMSTNLAPGFLFVLVPVFTILAGTATITVVGSSMMNRVERFNKYVKVLGMAEFCNISDLALKVSKSTKFVVKDVNNMIKKGWFKQGHLDDQNTCLIITDSMYEQYKQLEQRKALHMKEEEERKQREKASMEQQAKEQQNQDAYRKSLAPEVQKVIEQGDAYIKKIRECNDAIPGEEISAKIDHMEMIVDRIFDRVEQNPQCVKDIRKLMEYYLPTTIKLLEAYAEMDAQPIGGDNIQTAKKEIEATLDTLNTAFEKLLDSLFQEKAWDVSSDISVLNTMLAQEGLKEDGLKK